ncbi:kallikrein-8-like [Anticarsia gemmatalis]|uniref:kallikrein-8-like n=1 Tax=Anticarsia gemmatalis TaxID=129554 RepID=UPI003F777F18
MNFIVTVIFVFGFIATSAGENVKKSIDDNRDDTGETSYESKDESLDIPVENDSANNATCARRQNSQMHEIRCAKHNQFPFMVAIMSQQNEYLCAGCVVSNGIILTTATCTQQPLSYVLLNTTTDKKDDSAVSLHVIKTERFPTFAAGEPSKDIGIVYTEKHNNSIASKIKLSNFTNPRVVTDVEAIGFGLNSEIGHVKELQYIGLEIRYVVEVAEVVGGYFDCVETKVLTCFKDAGGPVVFDNELIGVILRGQNECTKEMSGTYAVNKRMVDIMPTYVFKAWLDEKLKKNEDQEPVALAVYPFQPEVKKRAEPHKMTSSGAKSRFIVYPFSILLALLPPLSLY